MVGVEQEGHLTEGAHLKPGIERALGLPHGPGHDHGQGTGAADTQELEPGVARPANLLLGEGEQHDHEGEEHHDRAGVDQVEKSDGKVMIISGDKVTEFKTDDGEDVDLHFIGEESEDGKKHKVMIIESVESSDDGEKRITVKVIEQIKIHLEEVKENDFSDVANINAKVLKTDDLNYYPNPNSGKFSLEFKASKKPTEIKITSLDGKTVYAEELQNFEGTYQNEIDLSSQKRGVYLLQIIQGNKAVNKKIVIE